MSKQDFTVIVNPKNPEATVAIIRLLEGLGYAKNLHLLPVNKLNFIYIRQGKFNGWDTAKVKTKSGMPKYAPKTLIDTTYDKLDTTITLANGKKITLSKDSYRALEKGVNNE